MIVTREIKRTYEVEFFPFAFDCTVGEFVEQREKLRLPTAEFKRCFICGRRLSMHKKPIVISVSGKGNRFSCDSCYEANKESNKENHADDIKKTSGI